ncbi:MAG: glutamine--tRNA ligase/YqeY domain fusion protein [Candidatus Marinimicrobia bacterium]|nr:glutamine--tRNA ligase/YqeY domain fusion protein [Candidatus Neomarinimicrobiota bacterium]
MTENKHRHFIQRVIDEDNETGKFENRVQTRFPPEPNGHLHIGHAKAICLDFGIAKEYGGKCNLRFDDTNPIAEEEEYVDAIQEDVHWLGFEWDKLCFASDYFQQMHDYAVQLINQGDAYVCDLTAEEIRTTRGTLKEPGKESPFRKRSIEENVDFFNRMKNGEFSNGSKTLRANIDMAHPNLNMRDPVIYRILHANHHNTGDNWCIYPMYDWAHGLEDSIENVTHSLCTTEFEDHRPIYDWFLDRLDVYHPQQIEFARLNLSYTLMSKRKLKQLVEGDHVNGWDDPRMPTLSGLRRRGYTPKSIRNFMDEVGIAKRENVMEIAKLEAILRDDLNKSAERRMAVLKPLKVIITNYEENKNEELDAINNPEDESAGSRIVPFSRELYIEQDDFMEDPPKKFFRLAPGREVRLRYAYFITCNDVIKDEQGNIIELHCTYDPATKGGSAPDGRKVKATIHWVSAIASMNSEVRLYDRLFTVPNPAASKNFEDVLNPESLVILNECKLEPSLSDVEFGEHIQFERLGYFYKDPDSTEQKPVFNRTVPLRNTWAKLEKQQQSQKN